MAEVVPEPLTGLAHLVDSLHDHDPTKKSSIPFIPS